MVTLNRTDFLIQCAKAKKSFNDTLPCIIDMEDDLWTVDETLYNCDEGSCVGAIKSLDTWNELDICDFNKPDEVCTYDCTIVSQCGYEYWENSSSELMVICCCGSIGDAPYCFSQEFLNNATSIVDGQPNLSIYNGSGPYDCVKLMAAYSATEEGDYCDRVHLELWNNIADTNNPYNL
jgi:hypothetical protein